MIEHEIIETIEQFRESFDTKNWSKMSACLFDEIFADYSTLRGTKLFLKNSEYITLRKNGLRNLTTDHLYANHKVTLIQDRALCECEFTIKRFNKEGTDYFHSYGKYFFELMKKGDDWKIMKITQIVHKSEGNHSIHGAVVTQTND